MVKNSRRKKKTRAAAAANGTNYTTAMRAQETVTSSARLPQPLRFPTPGTAAFTEALRRAKGGVLRLGETIDGGHLDWNLNEQPHGLFAGRTGSGKTIALNAVVSYGLALPEAFEVLICDPKYLELDWAAQYLGADSYAMTAVETHRVAQLAHRRMEATRSALEAVGAANLGELGEKLRAAPDLEAVYGPAPKRTLLVIDGLPPLLAATYADPQWEEVATETRTYLEGIVKFGGDAGISLIWSAQVLDRKILGPVLHGMDGLRVGIGSLDEYNLHMLFGPAGTPAGVKERMHWGRAAVRDRDGDREATLYYLPAAPADTETVPEFLRPNVLDVVKHRQAS